MFLPPSIDLGKPEKYILSIRITDKGVMFSITDPENNSNFCLRETTFAHDTSAFDNIQRIVFEASFLTLEFKATNVVFVSATYDVVPAVLYDDKQKDRLYNYVHADKANRVLSHQVVKLGAVSQFGVDKEIYDFLFRSLYNPYFFHHSGLLIDYFSRKGKTINLGSKMFVYFHDQMLDILCYDNSRLIHCLTVQEEQDSDQLYHILKVWEQCNFNQAKDQLYVAGTASEKVMGELYKYVKNVELTGAPSEVFLWNEEAQRTPIDLLSLSL